MAETRKDVPNSKTNKLTELCNTETEGNEPNTQTTCKLKKHSTRCEYKFHIEKCLLRLVDFLTPYLPLVDSHTSDFITKDQWNTYIPAAIQGQLLHLSDDQLLLLPSGAVHWPPQSTWSTTLEDHIPHGIKGKNSRLADLECKTLKWSHNNLEEFIKSAHENTLPQLAVLTAIEDLKMKYRLTEDKTPFVKDFMSKQKSHEVAVMAQLCHSLCQRFGICKIVDLGSGKGYLGTQLAFSYDLKVFGIDSADQNTSGANKRAKILKKQWSGLIKKFTLSQNSYQNQPVPNEEESLKIQNQNQNNGDCGGNLQKYVATTTEKEPRGFYCPFTTYVNSDTNILQLIAEHDKCEADAGSQGDSSNLLVAGLHTCGNLCPTALRFFSQNPAAHLLCNVSCCYHLLTEEFDPNGAAQSEYGFPVSSILRKMKFHLGQNTKNLACQSVNRIISSSKLTGESLFQRALLQKIFIDTLSKQEQNSLKNSIKLRKLASKCSSFYDYVEMAFQKLDRSSEKISEEMVQDYLVKYEEDKKKLAAFFQVKSALAPCIEALIALDRIYYLLEQESIKDVSLLQLFDPVTSPRCYGIVAVKKIAVEDTCSAVAKETDVTTDTTTDVTTGLATDTTTDLTKI
ncbi:methyltransferase-like protein 25 isoform X2 [Octopus sinensis]|uniref:Methyltransferase-like protein 25 isoform X2 n=1 Tax=Octopus sinensis TaxID=2607531 RepID=A0A6P7TGL4_9MOLL|nr:methyltransferase-like protein 25 isoform X2 [Octopus sinensis]